MLRTQGARCECLYHPPLLNTESVELQSNVAQRHHGRVTGTQQWTGSGVDLSVHSKYSTVRTVFRCTSKLFTGSQKEAVSYASNKCNNCICNLVEQVAST